MLKWEDELIKNYFPFFFFFFSYLFFLFLFHSLILKLSYFIWEQWKEKENGISSHFRR